MSDVERLLRSALVPVEPPVSLTDRLEGALSDITDAAAGELADWELRAMGDPRNWVRPIAAVVVGGAAAGSLVLVRARQQNRGRGRMRPAAALQALERSARDVSSQVRRRLGRQPRRLPLR
jgi:hypothetical protein